MRREIDAHSGYLGRRVDGTLGPLSEFAFAVKSGNYRTADFPVDVQRRDIFEFMVRRQKQLFRGPGGIAYLRRKQVKPSDKPFAIEQRILDFPVFIKRAGDQA